MYGSREILRDLIAVRGGRATFHARAAVEHHLCMLLREQGHAALRAALDALPGLSFVEEPTGDRNAFLFVSEAPDGPPLVVTAYRGEHSSSLNVGTERPGAQAPEDPRHRRFYEIWNDLTGVVDVDGLDPPKRAVFLVASFEADVMNGGVGQYLANSQGEHLEAVLRCLEEIGATGSADLLRRAVSVCSGEGSFTAAWEKHSEALGRIDDQLLALGEDLAGLTFDAFLAPMVE